MATADELLARFIKGEKVRGIMYAALESVFRRCGYMFVGAEGPYRTWKHHHYHKLITVRDEGSKAMYPRYIDVASDHIQKVMSEGDTHDA